MKFCDNVGDPSHFLMPLPDYLYRVSFSRYSPRSLEVVEKPNKCKSFWPRIPSGGTTPTFLRQIVSTTYHPPFGKVQLSSSWVPFADLRLRSLAMKWNANFTDSGWNHYRTSNLKPFVDQSSCLILRRRRRPPAICNAFVRLSITCFVPKI